MSAVWWLLCRCSFDEAKTALLAGVSGHLDVLPCFDFQTEVADSKDLVKTMEVQLQRGHVTRCEHFLCLTLQGPDSKSFKDRLLEFTSELSSKVNGTWDAFVGPKTLAKLVRDEINSAPAQPDTKDKKDKDKKRDKGSTIAGSSGDEAVPKKKKREVMVVELRYEADMRLRKKGSDGSLSLM